jgi:excisionase family DNA binding protein
MNTPQRRALKGLPPPKEIKLEPLLTVAQVAELLGKSIDAVRKMVYRGDLPAVRMGTRGVRFRRSEIAHYPDNLPRL